MKHKQIREHFWDEMQTRLEKYYDMDYESHVNLQIWKKIKMELDRNIGLEYELMKFFSRDYE